jgi:protein O-GlcNAc transferase
MSTVTLTLPEAFRLAVEAHERRDLVEAERLCGAILGAAPDAVDAVFLFAVIQHQRGRPRAALAGYDRVLALWPDHVATLNNRGVALVELKRFAEGLVSHDAALAINPNDAEALNNRGIALKELERLADALASYDRALAIRPDYVDALNNRGTALHALRRFDEALASYDRALAIAPGRADMLNHRGNALKALRRHDAALASYDAALAVAPDHAGAHYNRGLALVEIDRVGEALASFERALVLAPDYADAHCGRAGALKRQRRFAEAMASYQDAVARAPDHEFAFGGVADCALAACDFALQDRLSGEVRRCATEGPAVIPPLTLMGYCDDEPLQLACAKRFAQARIGVAPAPLWRGTRRRNDCIRVAYLSADFRQHPVAQLVAELFERHDRAGFEVTAISFGPDDRSDLRSRIVAGVDRFHDVRAMSDRDVAQLLTELRTDIAVDLAGYTLGDRPEILSFRPAPIAASFLGFAATMGVDFIDYIVADPVVLPLDRQAFYAEKIVHLPGSFLPNDSRRRIGAPPRRADVGLPDEAIVFCCFNNHAKIVAPVFDVWMRLLRAIEPSVLWLAGANDAVAGNLKGAAAARGVDPARLVFAPRLDRAADHLARHRAADLFLDTLPYNAHTTASDALWAGLPVLTCRGRSFAARVAASLLEAVGLPELVTASLADYEALALRLATDRTRLAAITAKLERNRAAAPLFDTDRFRRHLEAAYRTMWDTWQRGEPPQSFAVAPEGVAGEADGVKWAG